MRNSPRNSGLRHAFQIYDKKSKEINKGRKVSKKRRKRRKKKKEEEGIYESRSGVRTYRTMWSYLKKDDGGYSISRECMSIILKMVYERNLNKQKDVILRKLAEHEIEAVKRKGLNVNEHDITFEEYEILLERYFQMYGSEDLSSRKGVTIFLSRDLEKKTNAYTCAKSLKKKSMMESLEHECFVRSLFMDLVTRDRKKRNEQAKVFRKSANRLKLVGNMLVKRKKTKKKK